MSYTDSCGSEGVKYPFTLAWTTGQTYYLWGQLGELGAGQEISNVKFDVYIGKSCDSCIYESDVPVKVRAGGRYLAAVDIYKLYLKLWTW